MNKQICEPPREYVEKVGGGSFADIGNHCKNILVDTGKLKPSDIVLDIGSGCGRVAVPLTGYLTTGKYEGFDVDKEMVDWCKNNISTKHKKAQKLQLHSFGCI